jgi:hypothetical protein
VFWCLLWKCFILVGYSLAINIDCHWLYYWLSLIILLIVIDYIIDYIDSQTLLLMLGGICIKSITLRDHWNWWSIIVKLMMNNREPWIY